ncbi:hypothetical protein ACKC7Z_28065, partial [Klebsiella pneumoniae]
GKNSLNRLIRCVCGKKIGPDPRNFNQRVSLGRNDLLIRTFLNGFSRFDPEYLLRYERSSFIQNLSRKLVMPVVPELEETNYLLTQAIADYLSTFEHCELDGILFASAQKPKESTDPSVMNIILFHKSSGVLNADRRFREAEVNMYQHDEDISYFDPEIRTTPDDFRREFKVLSRKK